MPDSAAVAVALKQSLDRAEIAVTAGKTGAAVVEAELRAICPALAEFVISHLEGHVKARQAAGCGSESNYATYFESLLIAMTTVLAIREANP